MFKGPFTLYDFRLRFVAISDCDLFFLITGCIGVGDIVT